ncbi:MAG: SIS domain-containing protein [Firmicutes bacterium]|nr:SIS domain-containing protein [Bacillota bacterium]
MSKKDFKTFTEKEIFEIPSVIRELTKEYQKIVKSDEFLGLQDYIHLCDCIHIVGCGTAYHAGLMIGLMFERLVGKRARVYIASEFEKPVIGNQDLGIVISQSGETTDTLDAMSVMKKSGMPIVAICNVKESSIVRDADTYLPVLAGEEIGIASTKAYVAQVLVGFALASGKCDWDNMAMFIESILKDANVYKELAKENKDIQSYFFMGRGFDVVTAKESALKLKEITYKHCEGYPLKEFRHGPIAMVDNRCLCVLFDGDGANKLSDELKQKGASIYMLEPDKFAWKNKNKNEVQVLKTILNIVPMQLVALYIAEELGLDVDKPRGLTKAVIVK